MTVRDLIKGSMRLIGAIAAGEVPSANEQADALSALNSMLESWSNEGLLIYQISEETFSLISGQQRYTMGPLGDFNTARPMGVSHIKVGGVDLEVLDQDEWALINAKNAQSTQPSKVFINWKSPQIELNFWPVPSSVKDVEIYTTKPLSTYASANDTISLPPGYERALRYNLALEIAPEFEKEPSGLVLKTATESKASIKRANIKPVLMRSDAFGITNRCSFDIMRGE